MEFNLWTVAEIASNVVDSALIILLASSVLKLRLQSKWFYLASITILSIICTLANMYCTSLSQMLVVLWIFLFAFLLLFTEGSLKLKLIWSLLTQVIFFGVDMLYTSIFFRIMSDVPIEEMMNPGPYRLFNMIVRATLLTIIVVLIRKKAVFSRTSFQHSLLLIICLVLSFVSLFLLLRLYNTYSVSSAYMLVSTSLVCLSNIVYTALFLSLVDRNETIRENSLVIQRLESDKKHFDTMNQYYEELSIWKHDMKKHLQALLSMTGSSDDSKELSAYVSQIEQGLEQTPSFIHTGNPMFDNLLSIYCNRGKNYGIRITLDLVVPSLDFIDPADLCSIIGNMWENALEGCQRAQQQGISDPSITFQTYVNANHFILDLTNTSTTSPYTDLHSSKTGSGHGVGLKSIQKLTDQYHGVCDFLPKEGSFTARIALPVHTESADALDSCVVLNWRSDMLTE